MGAGPGQGRGGVAGWQGSGGPTQAARGRVGDGAHGQVGGVALMQLEIHRVGARWEPGEAELGLVWKGVGGTLELGLVGVGWRRKGVSLGEE